MNQSGEWTAPEQGVESGKKRVIDASPQSFSLKNTPMANPLGEVSPDQLIDIVSRLGDVVIITNRSGSVTRFFTNSPEWEQVDYADLCEHVRNFLDDARANTRNIVKQTLRDNQIAEFETKVWRDAETCVTCRVRIQSLRNRDERNTGFIIVVNEQSEDELKAAEVRQRSEELEDLVYLIAHNLKSPIVSIEGFTGLILDELGADEGDELHYFIQRIRKNVNTMNEMINDLLKFSRFGKLETVFGNVDLNALLANLLLEIKGVASDDEISVEVDKPLPVVCAHPEGMKALFENLLSNAFKYRKPGEKARIRISCEELPRFYAFHITDQGIGMEKSFLKSAFQLFKRGGNTGTVDGTGVGLAICRRIVEKHDGVITLHSTLNKGTRVSFTIPKRQSSQPTC